MKMFTYIFIFSLFLASCGANKMKNETVISATALTSINGVDGLVCSCTTDYMPVCSADGPNIGKSYDNVCIATCMGATQTSVGHCNCSSSLMVCVDNATTIDECTALKNGSNITKFIPCNKTAL
jgi:hypothetical protein